MPGTNRLPPLLALLFVLAALSGCGSDEISGEIPADNAAQLTSALDQLRIATEAGSTECDQAQEQAQAFVDQVNQLTPEQGEVKAELQRAGDNLRTLVSAQCASSEPTDTTASTTTTTPTTTDTTSSTTTSSTTDTTSSTTDTTTEEQPPPDNDNGHGPAGNGPPDGGTGGGTGPGGGGSGDGGGDGG